MSDTTTYRPEAVETHLEIQCAGMMSAGESDYTLAEEYEAVEFWDVELRLLIESTGQIEVLYEAESLGEVEANEILYKLEQMFPQAGTAEVLPMR